MSKSNFFKILLLIIGLSSSIYYLTCSETENSNPFDPDNLTPPAMVSEFYGESGNNMITLHWTKSTFEIDLEGYLIFRKRIIAGGAFFNKVREADGYLRNSQKIMRNSIEDRQDLIEEDRIDFHPGVLVTANVSEDTLKPDTNDGNRVGLSKVMISIDTTDYTRIAFIVSGFLSYTDATANNNHEYEYLICAVDKGNHCSEFRKTEVIIPNKVPMIIGDSLKKITINEAESLFINLNTCVDDDEDKSRMTWNFMGFNNINCDCQDNQLCIKTIDKCWNGLETGEFAVTDCEGASDTLEVEISVSAVNQEPKLSFPSSVRFNEDESYEFNLSDCIFDCESSLSDMSIICSCFPLKLTMSTIGANQKIIIAPVTISPICEKKWSGTTTLTIGLTDGGENGSNAKTKSVNIPVEVTYVSHLPEEPNSPVPEAGARNISLSPTLEWECYDPDCDNLLYDVYLGKSSSSLSKKNSSPLSLPNFTLANLDFNTVYYWYVIANDGESATQGPLWNFTSRMKCELQLSSKSYSFTNSNREALLIIQNSGTLNTNWSIEKINCNWLSLNKTQGTLEEGNNQTIVLTANCSGLSNGNHSGKLIVSSCEGEFKDTIDISLSVAPEMSVSTTSLNFGTSSASLTFNITNSGCGSLTWSVSEALSWLSVSPISGTTTTESDQITVTVNRSALACGTNSGTISVSSDGGSQTISVSAQKNDPVLVVSTTSLNFGTSSASLTFNITNSGCGSLTWSVSEALSWLSVSPISGTTTTESDQITVTVNRSALSAGNYSGTITVNGSTGGTKSISISMSVQGSGQWVSYDDGGFEGGFTVGGTGWLWMCFDRPSGWSSARVTKVKIYLKSGASYSFDIDGFDAYQYYEGNYYPSGSYIGLKSNATQSTGWSTHENITPHTFTSSKFYVAVYCYSSSGPYLGNDNSNTNSNRCGGIAGGYNLLLKGYTYGIQIYVENSSSSTSEEPVSVKKGFQDQEIKGKWLNGEVINLKSSSNFKGNNNDTILVETINKMKQ